MWFIEIYSGSLRGTVIPVDSDGLILAGAAEPSEETAGRAADLLELPDCLPKNTTIDVRLAESDDTVFYTVSSPPSKKKKTGRAKSNKIYKVRGLQFFFYPSGKRRPALFWAKIRKHHRIVLAVLVVNVLLTVQLSRSYLRQCQGEMAAFLDLVSQGYVRDGVLYVDSPQGSAKPGKPEVEKGKRADGGLVGLSTVTAAIGALMGPSRMGARPGVPWVFSQRIKQLPATEAGFTALHALHYRIVSKSSGQPLPAKNVQVREEGLRAVIGVKTFEQNFKVLSELQKKSVDFTIIGESVYVDDPATVKGQLKKEGVALAEGLIKKRRKKRPGTRVIDRSTFPYGIFYSSRSASYLYDEIDVRYWKGSDVPGYGTLLDINEDAVVFLDDDGAETVYLFSDL